MKYMSDMDGCFQIVSSRSMCWPSIINLALTLAEKWTYTQKLNLKVQAHLTDTLTCTQMIQMALPLLTENNCATLF